MFCKYFNSKFINSNKLESKERVDYLEENSFLSLTESEKREKMLQLLTEEFVSNFYNVI